MLIIETGVLIHGCIADDQRGQGAVAQPQPEAIRRECNGHERDPAGSRSRTASCATPCRVERTVPLRAPRTPAARLSAALRVIMYFHTHEQHA